MEELADSAGAGRLDEDGSGGALVADTAAADSLREEVSKCRAGSEGPAGSAGAFKSAVADLSFTFGS